MREDKKENFCTSFGPGYRNRTLVRKIQIWPICASSEPDVMLEELQPDEVQVQKISFLNQEIRLIQPKD